MKEIAIALILAAVGYFAFTILLPYDETWLHGEWKYQGDEEDYMVFRENGSVELRNAKRVYARCVYAVVVDDEVSVECEVKGKVHELVFGVSDNRRALTNREHEDSVYRKNEA